MEIIDFKRDGENIIVSLDDEVDFALLLSGLNERITTIIQQNNDQIFRMSLNFNNRKLEKAELLLMLDVLQCDEKILVSGINCRLDEKIDIEIYEGSVRAGQIIYFENSAMILGDINPSGMVIARHNIYVVGKIYGRAVSKSRSGSISAVSFIDSIIQIFDSKGTLINLQNNATITYENSELKTIYNKGGEARYVKSGSSYVR